MWRARHIEKSRASGAPPHRRVEHPPAHIGIRQFGEHRLTSRQFEREEVSAVVPGLAGGTAGGGDLSGRQTVQFGGIVDEHR